MTTRLDPSAPRPPPSSPSLVALSEVVPPSPILSPSDLPTPLTSGEIPILLFDSPYVTTASFDGKENQLFFSPDPRTWEFNLSRSTLQAVGCDLDGLSFEAPTGAPPQDLVNTTVASDTFARFVQRSARHRLSLCWSSNLATGDFIRDGQDDHGCPPVINGHDIAYYEDSWIGAPEWDSQPMAKVPLQDRGEGYVSLRLEPRQNHETQLANNGTPPMQDLLQIGAQLEDRNTIIRIPSSTSSSNSNNQNRGYAASFTQGTDLVSSQESLDNVHTDDTGDIGSRGFDSGEISLIDFCMGEISSTHVATMSSNSSLSRRPAIHATCPSPTFKKESQISALGDASPSKSLTRIICSARQGDPSTGSNGIISTIDGSSDIQCSPAVHNPPSPSLQSRPTRITTAPRGYQHHDYPWLQSTKLALVIDQEGFRTIEPVFKQVGITRRRLNEFGNTELDVATFVPTMRHAFCFHYAPFDGLPILRRLTVNGDEGRDFLSRQAYLSLKSTGVYTVHGTEVASSQTAATSGSWASIHTNLETAHMGSRARESTRLYWRFDYSVEDRKAEQTGRILDGERILVPLTFICSPQLLHPSQGRRIKLMQIVKKSITPRLVAERKQSPSAHLGIATTTTSPASGVPPSPSWKANAVHATQLYLAKSQAWNLHRRSHSNPREHGISETPSTSPKASPTLSYDTSTNPSISNGDDSGPISVRRRRASSAGEGRTGALVSPTRHILPPSRLRQLLVEGQSEEDTPSGEPFVEATPKYPLLDFFPLKPSPRFRN